jgi:hypothetical protein
MSQHTIRLSFISEMKKGAKGKIAERQRENEGEREQEAADVVSVVKQTVRKHTC